MTTTVTFTINDVDFTFTIPSTALLQSGFIKNLQETYQLFDDTVPLPIILPCIYMSSEDDLYKLLDIFVQCLMYIDDPNHIDFVHRTKIMVSDEYDNEYIDELFKFDGNAALANAFIANMLAITDFMEVPSIYNYLCKKMYFIIQDAFEKNKDNTMAIQP